MWETVPGSFFFFFFRKVSDCRRCKQVSISQVSEPEEVSSPDGGIGFKIGLYTDLRETRGFGVSIECHSWPMRNFCHLSARLGSYTLRKYCTEIAIFCSHETFLQSTHYPNTRKTEVRVSRHDLANYNAILSLPLTECRSKDTTT